MFLVLAIVSTAVTAIVAAKLIVEGMAKYRHDDLAESNRKVFSSVASLYDHFEGQANFRKLLGRELVARSEWVGINLQSKDFRVLDYACGTGVVSEVLAPYSGEVIGVDLADAMVKVYNDKAQRLGHVLMHAAVGDLVSEESSGTPSSASESETWNFDLVVIALGFHHLGNLQLAVRRLSERLKPGGTLLIIDFGPHEPMSSPRSGHGIGLVQRLTDFFGSHGQDRSHGHSHGHGDGHDASGSAHSGFGKEQICKLLKAAGLEDVAVDDLATGFKWGPPPIEEVPVEACPQIQRLQGMMETERDIFIAKGTRAV